MHYISYPHLASKFNKYSFCLTRLEKYAAKFSVLLHILQALRTMTQAMTRCAGSHSTSRYKYGPSNTESMKHRNSFVRIIITHH